MARRRVIVGLGEALLAEDGDREEPAGLAPLVALHATRLGHLGIAISRLGQDDAGRRLIERLSEQGVDVSHLQSDPDLPTGRRIARRRVTHDAAAAYENMQWDFDLSDIAQQADAVVFGALARASGQTRSTSDRFLAECRFALRVFDLTNRPADGLVRSRAMPAIASSEALVVDDDALAQLSPGSGRPEAAIAELLHHSGLSFVLHCTTGQPPVIHNAESSWKGAHAYHAEQHEAYIVSVLHAVLAGRDLHAALQVAERVVEHARTRPDDALPSELVHDV